MTSDLALDRLARLERQYDGPIPAPLRRWALSGAPALPEVAPAPAPATDHRTHAAAAFAQAKALLGKARRDGIRREQAVSRADVRFWNWRIKANRDGARTMLTIWRRHRDAEAAPLALAAE